MPRQAPTVEVTQDVPVSEELPDGYVSVKDAATYLNVTPETVRRWLASGRIQGTQVHSGARGRLGWRWVIDTKEVKRMKRVNVA